MILFKWEQTNSSRINEWCSLIPFTFLRLRENKDTVPEENATSIAQPNIHIACQLSIIFQYTSNISGYICNHWSSKEHAYQFFFLPIAYLGNTTAQTINILQQGEMIDPEITTYFSTIEHILAVRSSLKSWSLTSR